eukprot:m.204627 g.204627  ORF g.204627 m.204627 type:complete len:891 (-) comp15395_c0_seq1:6373-9045(-)
MDATSGAGPAQSVSDQPSIDSGGPDAMEVESAVTSVAPLAAAPATTAATTGDAMSVDPPVSKSAPDSTSPAVDSADATATTAETMTVTPTAATSEAAALPVSAPDTEPPAGPGAPNAAPAATSAATGSKPVPDASFNKPKADASYKPKADASYTPASVSYRPPVKPKSRKPKNIREMMTEKGLSLFGIEEDTPTENFKAQIDAQAANPEEYARRTPRCRARLSNRKRYEGLYSSQIKRLHPDPYQHDPLAVKDDPYAHPAFYVPGVNFIQAKIDPDSFRRAEGDSTPINWPGQDRYYSASNAHYRCPIPGCSKHYRGVDGLLVHMMFCTCVPEPAMWTELDRKWALRDGRQLGDVGGLFDAEAEPLLRDYPYLTQYKWPQDEELGIWCIAVPQLSQFGFARQLNQIHLYLDHRVASDEEVKFLSHHCAQHISDFVATRSGVMGGTVQVFKANEVLYILEKLYPDKYQRLLELRTRKDHPASAADASASKAVNVSVTLLSQPRFTPGNRKEARERAALAAKQAAKYNAQLMAERREERFVFYDQFTQVTQHQCGQLLHVRPPKRHSKFSLAVMPGQFEHPYKRLRTLPDAMAALHGTDRAGMELGGARARRPVEENFARQRERVQAKIKARHEGRPDQKAMRPAPTDATCGICNGTGEYNKAGVREPLVCCSKCPNFGHPSCLQLTDEITDMIRTYEWTCLECKVCTVCTDAGDDDKMLFCDVCDRGYHTFCVNLNKLPKGRWVCKLCGMCASCGKTSPGDAPGSKWQHQYADEVGDTGEPIFLQTLCVLCSALFESGDFCPSCLVVYRGDEHDLPMVCCDKCDRWYVTPLWRGVHVSADSLHFRIHTECDDIDDEQYEEMSEEGSFYECLLCRGEQKERCDRFHRAKRAS